NNFVHIKAFIQEGWKNRKTGKVGDPRVKYRSFKQLQDIMEDYAKKLTLQIDVDELKEEKIDALEDIVINHSEDCILNYVDYELKEHIIVQMPSRKQKVNISSELLDRLQEEQFDYRIN